MSRKFEELRIRQVELYNLLMTEPNKWFSQYEICSNVKGYVYSTKNWDACPVIREDMNKINASDEYEHIIVMKDRCFKIANEDEARAFYNQHIRALKNQVEICKNIKRKIGKDNTTEFDIYNDTDELREIDTFIKNL